MPNGRLLATERAYQCGLCTRQTFNGELCVGCQSAVSVSARSLAERIDHDIATDIETGMSIRFVKQYDVAADTKVERCAHLRNGYVCERERGHSDSHRCYNIAVDAPVFWDSL